MTRHLLLAFITLGVLAASPQPALADCKSDLALLKARLAHERDPAVLRATQPHVKRAEIETKGSESECRNAVTRGFRAMKAAREAAAIEAADKRLR
jgi:hypothetical protein